jgi:PmbA protein
MAKSDAATARSAASAHAGRSNGAGALESGDPAVDLLARLSARTDEAEVFRASSDSIEVRFTSGKVKTAVARETSGLAVRALKGGRMGFAAARDVSPQGVDRLVANAERSVDVGDTTDVRFPGHAEPPAGADALDGWHLATSALGVAELVRIGESVLSGLVMRFPGVVFDASVRRGVGETTLVNTAGADVRQRATSISVSVEANATRENDVLLDWAGTSSPALGDLELFRMIDQLTRRLLWSEKVVSIEPGRMPVLFSPQGALVLWGPLLEALGGKTVMLGTSPLREKLGTTVLDPRVSITDDGLVPGALGSSAFDEEGLPRRRTPLIARGVLKSFVHDLETARATKQQPTGNGDRPGIMGRPGPGFTNVIVGGGDQPSDRLIAGIDRGLLVHSVIGMGQGNTLPGSFSNPVDLAFLIEGGQVVGRVKDVSIAGNVYELLAPGRLHGLSSEQERVHGSWRLPWVRIDDMNVVGKG